MTFEQLDKVLDECVFSVVGEHVGPRPGQKQLAHDIYGAMIGEPTDQLDENGELMRRKGRVLGVAPTGVGKTLAALAPAFLRAVIAGERTVISTESLSLQAQILDKDAPMFADAVERVTGVRPTFAVLKGFGNYVCPLAAHSAAVDVLGADDLEPKTNPHISPADQRAESLALLADAKRRIDNMNGQRKPSGLFGDLFAPQGETVRVGESEYDKDTMVSLLSWALGQAKDGDGDKSRFTGTTGRAWGAVSVSPSDCPGKNKCPFGQVCLPRKGREDAQHADVIVTNHSILAVQANMGVPVVFGNLTLGDFDHIIVDEAHALPGVIRNGGGREIGVRRITQVVKAFTSCMDTEDGNISQIVEEGKALASRIDMELGNVVGSAKPGEAVKPKGENPLTEWGPVLQGWCRTATKALPQNVPDSRTQLKIMRAGSRLQSLYSDCEVATREDDKGEFARWVEAVQRDDYLAGRGWSGAVFKLSPVDVAPSIGMNLMRAPQPPDEEGNPALDEEGNQLYKRLSVAMISATIPPGFPRDTGLMTRAVDYPSPFDSAYGKSMVFVPRVNTEEELSRIASRNGGRWKFDTGRHTEWATEYLLSLVRANEGHALVLSATKRAGAHYAEELRKTLPSSIRVFSQWDGRDPRQIVAEWRADTSSVMVGTRSLMTGVDASGETCSLVIVDRIPRDAGNVVDDARVDLLCARQEMDKWSSQRLVYGSDAALRLEQAAGRLIRSTSDSGMLAVLDPRLVPKTPLAYPKSTGDLYLGALRRFPVRKSQLKTAVSFLEGRSIER